MTTNPILSEAMILRSCTSEASLSVLPVRPVCVDSCQSCLPAWPLETCLQKVGENGGSRRITTLF
jgi:hypothetical protein